MELKFGNDPNLMQQILKLIDEAIEMQFPGVKAGAPEQYQQVKTQVINDLSKTIEQMPSVTQDPARLKIYIKNSIHAQPLSLEKQIEKALKRHHPNLNENDVKEIKKDIMAGLNDISNDAPSLVNNPKTREPFIAFLMSTHPKLADQKPQLGQTSALENSMTTLKRECQKLILTVAAEDKELATSLENIFKTAINNIQKNMHGRTPEEKQEASNGLMTLLNMLLFSDAPKQFADLPEKDRTKIISDGSLDGTYQLTPQTSAPIPNIVVHLATPMAHKVLEEPTPQLSEEQTHSLPKAFDPRAGLTPPKGNGS